MVIIQNPLALDLVRYHLKKTIVVMLGSIIHFGAYLVAVRIMYIGFNVSTEPDQNDVSLVSLVSLRNGHVSSAGPSFAPLLFQTSPSR